MISICTNCEYAKPGCTEVCKALENERKLADGQQSFFGVRMLSQERVYKTVGRGRGVLDDGGDMTKSRELLAWEFAYSIVDATRKSRPLIRMRDWKTMETAEYEDTLSVISEQIKRCKDELLDKCI